MLASILIKTEFWLTLALWIAIAVTAWSNRRVLRQVFSLASPRQMLLLGGLTLFAALLRLQPETWQHNVFDDEYTHLRLAAEMGSRFRFALVSPRPCLEPLLDVPPCPPGFHFALGCVFHFAGQSSSLAFLFNALCGTIAVPAIFFLARLLFESDWTAYTAAALLAVWPLHVGLSRGASLEVFAQLALVLLGLALALATRKPSLATAALALQMAAWAALTRNELLLGAPLSMLVVFSSAALVLDKPAAWRRPLILLTLCVPLMLPLAHFVFATAHYNQQRDLLPEYPLLNALLYWIRADLFCPLWTLMGLAGACMLFRRQRRWLTLALLAVWVADILVVSVYRKVDPTLGDQQRYFLLGGTVPLLLTAYSVGRARERGRVLAIVLLAAALVCVSASRHSGTARSPLATVRLLQERWLRSHVGLLPQKAIVFTESADFLWAATGVSGLSMRNLADTDCLRRLSAEGSTLYVLRETPIPRGSAKGAFLSSADSGGESGGTATASFALTPLAEGDVGALQPIGLYQVLWERNPSARSNVPNPPSVP